MHRHRFLPPDQHRAEDRPGPHHPQRQQPSRVGVDGEPERNRRCTAATAAAGRCAGGNDDRPDVECSDVVDRAILERSDVAGSQDVRAVGAVPVVGHPWWQQGGQCGRHRHTAHAVGVRPGWSADRWYQCGGVERHRGQWRESDGGWRLRHGVSVWHPSGSVELELHDGSDDPELGDRSGVGGGHGVLLRVRHGAPARRRVGVLPDRFGVQRVGPSSVVGHPWWQQGGQCQRHRHTAHAVGVRPGWSAEWWYRCGGHERHGGPGREPDDRWRLRHRVSVWYPSGSIELELHRRSDDPELGDRPSVSNGHGVLLRVRHGAPDRRRVRIPVDRFRVHPVGPGPSARHP